jgi:hypothetical protein
MTSAGDPQSLHAQIDVDGWNSLDPRWRDRVDATSGLALTVETLRRAVELRDVLAESGSRQTIRALFLTDVVNELLAAMVRDRAGPDVEIPFGTGPDIVGSLYDRGIMTPSEYRSASPDGA